MITQPLSSPSSSGSPDLAGLLAQAALATAADATILATAWAQKKQQDLSQQQTQAEALLSSDLTQQAEQAKANAAQNAAMQTAAGQDVSIASAPSDFEVWYLKQLALVPGWEYEVKLWNHDQAVKKYEEAKKEYAAAERKRQAAIAAAIAEQKRLGAAIAAKAKDREKQEDIGLAQESAWLRLQGLFNTGKGLVQQVLGDASSILATAQPVDASQVPDVYLQLLSDDVQQTAKNLAMDAQSDLKIFNDTATPIVNQVEQQIQQAQQTLAQAKAVTYNQQYQAYLDEEATAQPLIPAAPPAHTAADYEEISDAQKREAALVALAKLSGPMTPEEQDLWDSALPSEQAQPFAIANYVQPAYTAADYEEALDAKKRRAALVALTKLNGPKTAEEQDLWNSASPSEQAQAFATASDYSVQPIDPLTKLKHLLVLNHWLVNVRSRTDKPALDSIDQQHNAFDQQGLVFPPGMSFDDLSKLSPDQVQAYIAEEQKRNDYLIDIAQLSSDLSEPIPVYGNYGLMTSAQISQDINMPVEHGRRTAHHKGMKKSYTGDWIPKRSARD